MTETHEQEPTTFKDDHALLQHILSKKPEEQLVGIPEWGVQLLCKTLDAKGRIAVEAKAWDKEAKNTDYRRALDVIVIHGCFNPQTNQPFFTEEHSAFLLASGGPTAELATTILRLSHMMKADVDNAKKN